MVTGDAVSGTRLVQACSEPAEQRGYVNPPIVRASTVVYDDVGTMKVSQADPLRRSVPAYGRGTTYALVSARADQDRDRPRPWVGVLVAYQTGCLGALCM
jgi:cystathionine beta-lyase/cystathionine gamma-synthase